MVPMSARVARSALGARSALVTRSLYSTDKGGHRFSGRAVVAFSAAAGVTAALAVRFAMRGRGDPDDAAHRPDGSRAEVSVRSQVPRLVRVLYVDADGEQRVARIDEEEFTAEQERRVRSLERSRGALRETCSAALRDNLARAYADCQGPERVRAFASWYYAYPTTYELTRVAVVAAATALPSKQPSREAAAEAVAEAVLDKYHSIVLRPAVSEPAIRHAFEKSATAAHGLVLSRLAEVHAEALPLLERHTTHLESSALGRSGVRLDVDWTFARGRAAGIETAHGRPSGVETAALISSGALIGSGIVGKVVGAAAGKAIAGAAAKALAGKLALPFAAKASSAVGSAAAAGAASSAGGPVGVAVGAGVGLAVDYALSKGVELLGRREMERDVDAALRTAQAEWSRSMEAELARVVDAIVDDAINLTVRQQQEEERRQRAPPSAAHAAVRPAKPGA